jgi:DNA-binding SARP family transcriptional activator/DNA-binding beta-propeller fold protein YncE
MDFLILGPLEVREQGSKISLGGGRERALLAVLLLHANEVVSTDRLIEELWGEQPPATAAKAVHGYVSQLRKALGDGASEDGDSLLTTHGRGYALRVEPGRFDRDRFERLVAEGQAALADGEAAVASRRLEGALELWRGPPLCDFTYDQFAQVEIARLEELRLTAVECRIEADLELGRHSTAVPALEALVAEHPLHERLRADLMLALYRSGRQADALQAYRAARRTLIDELGIEPGEELQSLHSRILAQDPELSRPRLAGDAARHARQPLVLLAGAAMVAAAAIAAIVLLATRSTGRPPLPISADSVAAIDPATGKMAQALPQPGVDRVTADATSVWVDADGPRSVSELDPSGRAPSQTVGVGIFPTDIALGEGALWVLDGTSGRLAKVNPQYGRVVQRTRFRPRTAFAHSYPNRLHPDPATVAAADGAVWITDGSRGLTQVAASDASVVRTIHLGSPLDGVAASRGAVWAISGVDARAFRLDPRSGDVTAQIPLVARPGEGTPFPEAVAIGAGFVWVLDGNTAEVTKIDPSLGRVLATIPLGITHGPTQIAAGSGAAWTANTDGTVSRIDARDGTVLSIAPPHRTALNVTDVAVGKRRIWIGASASAVPGGGG